MSKLFGMVALIDLLALAGPTRWMGPGVEFWLALILGILTGATWLALRFGGDGK